MPAAAGLLVLVYGMVVVANGNAERFTFGPIDDLGGEILGHIGAYLLPLIVSPDSSTEDILTTAIIMALIVHIHVATGRVLVNPLLYLIGRRVYSATVGEEAFYLVATSDVSRWVHGRAVRADRRQCARREAGSRERGRPMVTAAKVIEASRAHVADAVGLLVARLADDGRVEGAKLHLSANVADSFRGYCLGALDWLATATEQSYSDGAELDANAFFLIDDMAILDELSAIGDLRTAIETLAEHPSRRARPDDPAVRRRRRQRRRPRAVRASHQPAARPRRRQEVLRHRRRAPDTPRRAGVQLRSEVRLPRRRRLGDRPRPAVVRDALPRRSGWSPPTSHGGSVASPTTCPMDAADVESLRTVALHDSRTWRQLREIEQRGHLADVSLDQVERYATVVGIDPATIVAGGRLTFDPAQRFSFLHLLNEDLYKGQLTDELFEAQRKARASPQ